MTAFCDITLAHGPRVLCTGISFSIATGETLLLAGANGSGKTTLLRRIVQLHPAAVLLPTGIPKVGGFTLREFIRTACYRLSDWRGRLDSGGERRLDEALDRLGIRALEDRDIATLSDGEFQKACIATALLRRAELLLLDEPTAFLDPGNRVLVLRTLRELAQTAHLAVLFSSHDLHEALSVADRVFAFTPERRFLVSEATAASRAETIRAAFPEI